MKLKYVNKYYSHFSDDEYIKQNVVKHSPTYFTQRLAELSARQPNQIALIDRNRGVSFAELHAHAQRLSGHFARLGIGHQDRIAIWLPNCLAWVQAFLACAHLGATVLAVNTRFRSKELSDIIVRGRADWLVMWPAFKGIPFSQILAESGEDTLSRLKGILSVSEQDICPTPPKYESSPSNQPVDVLPAIHDDVGSSHANTLHGVPVHDFNNMLQSDCEAPEAAGNGGVLCFTTSGTTSRPKFVLHDQDTLIRHADGMKIAYGYDAESRIFASAPFCGAFGFSTLCGGLATGSTVVCEPVTDTESMLSQIRKHRVTHTYANNESILKWLESSKGPEDFASCKLFGFANFSPAVHNLLEQACEHRLELTGLYGSSELQALVAAQPLTADQGDISVRYLAGGKLIHPAARVRVRDPESGKVLPHGESGEIEILSPSQMVEYLDNPEATRGAFTEDGYFKTGDLGYSVSDQQFVFQTRMGDSMRLSGFLVNPSEIEQTVEALPGIRACQVVGATQGTRILPVAFVLLHPGVKADPEGWTAGCKQHMASFKVPVRFEVLEAFPTVESANAVKIQKNRLREMADQLLASAP